MDISEFSTLIRLGDTQMTPAEPSDDIRGRRVYDAQGSEIGHVDDLLIDDSQKKVRSIQVASGGFLGIGATKFLIPIDSITNIEVNAVHIDRHREHIAASPPYDPKLVDQDYVNRLYQHYGFQPYWMMGYTYPTFPFYL